MPQGRPSGIVCCGVLTSTVEIRVAETTVWAWTLESSGWLCVTASKDIRLLNFSNSARRVVTSSCSSMFSGSNWSILFFLFARVFRCESGLGEDVGPLSLAEANWPFVWKSNVWDSDIWNYKCRMMHDAYAKMNSFYFSKDF